ncbi:hypothetical protein B0T13DRAFT_523382 [Neurospora crassa]|nr:hypothetical protein B0T13DRAFT_523382 [Neurospora crassa]
MRAQGCSYMVTFSGYCYQQLPGQLLVGIIDSSGGIPPTLIMPHDISTSTLAPDGGDDLGAGGQDGCYGVAIRKRRTTKVNKAPDRRVLGTANLCFTLRTPTKVADMQLCAQANRPASVIPCKCIPDTLRQSRAKITTSTAIPFHLSGAGAATKHNANKRYTTFTTQTPRRNT